MAGTCTGNLYGMCETLWKLDMEKEELFETLAQALLASVDRDALSGWGVDGEWMGWGCTYHYKGGGDFEGVEGKAGLNIGHRNEFMREGKGLTGCENGIVGLICSFCC